MYKAGCDARINGFGVYKLFCKCTACEYACKRYRRPLTRHYNQSKPHDERKCSWFRIDGVAKRLDVGPDGFAYAVRNDGSVSKYDGVDWKSLSVGQSAEDITVSNEGSVYFTDKNHDVYRILDQIEGTTLKLCGKARAITAGPYSQPNIIGDNKRVYTSSKLSFN